jgi:hypothetical protein
MSVPGPAEFFPGEGNLVQAVFRGVMGDGTSGAFLVMHSASEEPSNRVVISGSSLAFQQTNEGLDTPAEEFFASDSQ